MESSAALRRWRCLTHGERHSDIWVPVDDTLTRAFPSVFTNIGQCGRPMADALLQVIHRFVRQQLVLEARGRHGDAQVLTPQHRRVDAGVVASRREGVRLRRDHARRRRRCDILRVAGGHPRWSARKTDVVREQRCQRTGTRLFTRRQMARLSVQRVGAGWRRRLHPRPFSWTGGEGDGVEGWRPDAVLVPHAPRTDVYRRRGRLHTSPYRGPWSVVENDLFHATHRGSGRSAGHHSVS